MIKRLISKENGLNYLYFGSFFSGLGNWMTSLVIFSWIYHVTQSPLIMSIGILAHRLPMSFGAWSFAKISEKSPIKARVFFDLVRFVLVLGMAVVMKTYEQASEQQNWLIYFFLSLAAIRSFFSGADGAVESKLISSLSESRTVAASDQNFLSLLLGLNGFAASILFAVGVLSYSFIGVLVFDSFTFLISAFLIRSLNSFFKKGDFKGNEFKTLGMLGTVRIYPSLWYIMSAHFLRNFVLSIALQQSLILLKLKFNGGSESSAYLYLALTLGWFLSAQFRKYFRLMAIGDLKFIYLTITCCVFAPFTWYLNSIGQIFFFLFCLMFLDGFLLADIGSEIQMFVKPSHIARFFSAHAFFSNLSVVIGAICLGYLTEKSGFQSAYWTMSILGLSILLIVLAIRLIFYDLVTGIANISIIKKYTNEPKFLISGKGEDCNPKCNHSISSSAIHFKIGGTKVICGSTIIGKKAVNSMQKAILKASYEAIERITSFKIRNNNQSPFSNASAIHDSKERSIHAALCELLERDSVLFHHLNSIPPVCKLNLKHYEKEILINTHFKAAHAYFFCTAQKGYYSVFVKLTNNDNQISLGWACDNKIELPLILSAIKECYSTNKIYSNFSTRALLDGLDFKNINAISALEKNLIWKSLNDSQKQIALVLFDPTLKSRLAYLEETTEIFNFNEAYLKLITVKTLPPIDYKIYDYSEIIDSPYYFSKIISENALVPKWPYNDLMQIQTRSDFRSCISGENIYYPCIIY